MPLPRTVPRHPMPLPSAPTPACLQVLPAYSPAPNPMPSPLPSEGARRQICPDALLPPPLPPDLCLLPGPSSSQLSICLAFPVNTNAISAFAAIGACSKLGPVLQSVYVTWNPTYCQFQAPSFVGTSGSQLGGGKMVVFTCWDAPDENRFSAQVGGLGFHDPGGHRKCAKAPLQGQSGQD